MTNRSLLDRLAGLDTNAVSEALDVFGLPPGALGVQPLWRSPRLVGVASTLRLRDGGNKPRGRSLERAITRVVGEHRVLVLSTEVAGRASWDYLASLAARQRGVRGTVLDSLCRSVVEIQALDYPVYARGVTMASNGRRNVVAEQGKPIEFAGQVVCEDDLVIADRCGVVFIPANAAEEVIALGERIIRHQDAMVVEAAAGHPCTDTLFELNF
ncbi:RraA family protein [Cupriavidus sp. L7L]|uniref:RraA family protein n=1 Tax=Cupriavidus sp. L7L TaxID=2546443 RepID=UPI0010559079|nr:RraA family protein [Cupriavidus sp. L7L]TDF63197.1 RraA family protein [Cupriavidus sp. L7L]